MRFRKSSFWNVKSNQLKLTSCASAPWLPWPPSASGQGSSRTQPQPTWGGSDKGRKICFVKRYSYQRWLKDGLWESNEPVLLSPPPLKSEPVPLPLLKMGWNNQATPNTENVWKCFHLEHHRGDKTLDLGRRKLLLLAILEMFKFWSIFFLIHYTWRRTSGYKSSQLKSPP